MRNKKGNQIIDTNKEATNNKPNRFSNLNYNRLLIVRLPLKMDNGRLARPSWISVGTAKNNAVVLVKISVSW